MSELSYLEKLLDGAEVEWKSLSELASLRRGRVMSKGYFVDNIGEYPVYSSQTANSGMIGSIDTFDFDGEFVSWTTDGANAGTVFYRTGKFSITNVCGLIKINDNSPLNYKYLFYWLSIEAKSHVYSGMGNPKLLSHQVEKIPVPIPCPNNPEKSLAIQSEIVRILDKFTALTAELTAELTARKKQYNYYRDQLLSFDEEQEKPIYLEKLLDGVEVEWKMLGEVIHSLKTGLNPRQNFSLNTLDAQGYYVTVREIQNGKVVFLDKTDRVNDRALKIINGRSNLEAGDILFSGTGTVGRIAVIEENPINWNIKEGVYTIKPIKEKIAPRFLSYLLQSSKIVKDYSKKIVGNPVISLPMGDLKKLLIPIPCPGNPEKSLAIQSEIVRILDKFDTLTNSITEGLPREIELRQKQYEYYRDLLFSFPKPDSVTN